MVKKKKIEYSPSSHLSLSLSVQGRPQRELTATSSTAALPSSDNPIDFLSGLLPGIIDGAPLSRANGTTGDGASYFDCPIIKNPRQTQGIRLGEGEH